MEKVMNRKVRSSYLTPYLEICQTEFCRPLASSPSSLSGGHDDGDDEGVYTAKEFDSTFSDLWESSWEDDISWENYWFE